MHMMNFPPSFSIFRIVCVFLFRFQRVFFPFFPLSVHRQMQQIKHRPLNHFVCLISNILSHRCISFVISFFNYFHFTFSIFNLFRFYVWIRTRTNLPLVTHAWRRMAIASVTIRMYCTIPPTKQNVNKKRKNNFNERETKCWWFMQIKFQFLRKTYGLKLCDDLLGSLWSLELLSTAWKEYVDDQSVISHIAIAWTLIFYCFALDPPKPLTLFQLYELIWSKWLK